MNRLRQMSIFAHIVEQGSVSAAADKLELSKSVVSQHLKTLEQELGITLLKRTTRRQSLTEIGEQFYQSCKNINLIADTAWDNTRQHQTEPSGRIRITAPHALMDTLIAPVIADLIKLYPKLRPELINDDQRLDFMQHDIDLAIRVGHSPDSTLKQRRIGQFRDVLCGHPKMIGKPLEELAYIANSWQGQQYVHHFRSCESVVPPFVSQARCITNSFHSCLALIRAGAGIGLIPAFYLEQLDNSIVNLTPSWTLPDNTVFALTAYNHHAPIAVQKCIELLAKQLSS
ncbi:LysR family transcriptional regulator [Vibrio panuliri]|uniref:Transcriptional regulator n=1 Tax=Vibrio panuliri TaxID=1381081 RepID=A0ABX3FL91_9VIBR|nr:LysR family transcriptional regulator [Vibrio panuliri]KAB1455119.1 LysR family transcriptional regulator [Vibrio panuliri]OLQ94984.1 transcriptional regulator [Vibrio panuliri]